MSAIFELKAKSPILPLVSKSFLSEEEARSALHEVAQGRRLGRDDGEVFVQPAESRIQPLMNDEILALVRGSEGWREVQDREDELTIQMKEFARCWLVLVTVGPEIPPGIGFVVDKHSRRVFCRRYIDVAPMFED